MDKEQHRAAKARLVAQMQAGRSWQAAAATAGMQISQSTAYRLLQVVRIRGEAALQDGRHGHRSRAAWGGSNLPRSILSGSSSDTEFRTPGTTS